MVVCPFPLRIGVRSDHPSFEATRCRAVHVQHLLDSNIQTSSMGRARHCSSCFGRNLLQGFSLLGVPEPRARVDRRRRPQFDDLGPTAYPV